MERLTFLILFQTKKGWFFPEIQEMICCEMLHVSYSLQAYMSGIRQISIQDYLDLYALYTSFSVQVFKIWST